MIKIFDKEISPYLNFKIDDSLHKEIVKFAKKNYSNREIFKFNGHGRQFCDTNNYKSNLSDKIKKFQKELMQKLNIENYLKEEIYGNFIGVNVFNNTNVHFHTDPRDEKDNIHFRLLFMLQNAQKGGNPVLEGNILKVKNKEGWINFASEWEHGSKPMFGKRLRIILSLGAYVPRKEFDKWII